MRALTIKQPWASLIMRCHKDIENRDWPTKVRGVIAVHTSAKLEKSEIEDACGLMRGFIPKFSERIFTAEVAARPDLYPTGCIIGTVELVGCAQKSESPWFVGEYGFVLQNPVVFAGPIPCKGKLGFWEVPAELMPTMREQWKAAQERARGTA